MPPIQRGSAYKIGKGRYGLRYYDADGERRRKSPFPSKSAALTHYRDVIEPQLSGGHRRPRADARGVRAALPRAARRDRSPADDRHPARTAHPRDTRVRDVPLRDLERMSGEIAAWQARLPERSRYGVVQALSQTLGAAVRWGYIEHNPAEQAGRNPQPSPRVVRRTAAPSST